MSAIRPAILASDKEAKQLEPFLDDNWEILGLKISERSDGLANITLDVLANNVGIELEE